MAKDVSVTMRVRVGDAELEVTGPTKFVEKKIAEFLKKLYTPFSGPRAAQSITRNWIESLSDSKSVDRASEAD